MLCLQIADLVAYPVTTHIIYPDRPNRSYEAILRNYQTTSLPQ